MVTPFHAAAPAVASVQKTDLGASCLEPVRTDTVAGGVGIGADGRRGGGEVVLQSELDSDRAGVAQDPPTLARIGCWRVGQ